MSDIESMLREACVRGLTHLTLWPVPSDDGKTIYWTARGTPSTMHKYVQAADTDPVRALRGVLEGLPKAPKGRAKTSKPSELAASGEEAEAPAETEITATVTDPQPETLDQWLPKS